MAGPDPSLSAEEYKHRGELNEQFTRMTTTVAWGCTVVCSAFFLGLFGFLTCLAAFK